MSWQGIYIRPMDFALLDELEKISNARYGAAAGAALMGGHALHREMGIRAHEDPKDPSTLTKRRRRLKYLLGSTLAGAGTGAVAGNAYRKAFDSTVQDVPKNLVKGVGRDLHRLGSAAKKRLTNLFS